MKPKAVCLLQWHAMKTAQARGCRWQDLCGIDPDGNPGPYHLRTGPGGVAVSTPGPCEMLLRRLAVAVIRAGDAAYRGSQSLRRLVGRFT